MHYPSFNIGIEEEYQLIDPQSRELLAYVRQNMGREQLVVTERRPELDITQSVESASIAAGTPVCADILEAREQLLRMRTAMLELAAANGFKIAAAGTHPFTRWETTSMPRYRSQVEEAQMIARRVLAFGLHIHIGMEDRELAVDVMNTMRYLLPHILALSTSSPFFAGRNTGLRSYRKVLIDSLPRTGIPGDFSGYAEYRAYVDTLVRTNCIPDASRIWFDIRPHHRFPTLVLRICDMVPNLLDTLAITALIQATVAWMVDLRQRNMAFRHYERILINENKWRAVRYGLDGKLIDFGVEEEVPVRTLVRELLERVEPLAHRLNSEDALAHVYNILERGAYAERQLAVWHANDEDLHAVVDYLVQETENIPW